MNSPKSTLRVLILAAVVASLAAPMAQAAAPVDHPNDVDAEAILADLQTDAEDQAGSAYQEVREKVLDPLLGGGGGESPANVVPDDVSLLDGPDQVDARAAPLGIRPSALSYDTYQGAADTPTPRPDVEENTQSSPPVYAARSVAPSTMVAVGLATGIGLVLAPLTLYRRVKKSQALDNDVRRSAYKFVENNPGATITEVADGVGVSHSTATYHVNILEEFDLIKKRRDGNSLHIFPEDASLGRKEALLLSYMRDRETREIIRSIYANPWTYPSELARTLDLSRSSTQWHLDKLEETGIVEVVRDGKFSYLYIDPEMKDTVQKYLVQ